jgi:hypothetical protein
VLMRPPKADQSRVKRVSSRSIDFPFNGKRSHDDGASKEILSGVDVALGPTYCASIAPHSSDNA